MKIIGYSVEPIYEEEPDPDMMSTACLMQCMMTRETLDTMGGGSFVLSPKAFEWLKSGGFDDVHRRVTMYERFLHDMQMYAAVVMDGKKIQKLIDNACAWSYSHRVGNGEYCEDEQDDIIRRAFDKLCDVD